MGNTNLEVYNGLPVSASNLKETLSAIKKEGELWNRQCNVGTPAEYIEVRKGQGEQELEYVKQFYTIRMLNTIFPGWEMEDMNFQFYPQVRTFVLTGYLKIKYPSLITGKMETRRVYAIGSAFILARKDAPTEPTQPEDMAKACRTEWIKLAGMLLGIGMDIYAQSITPDAIEKFETKIINWTHNDLVKSMASSFKTKGKFIDWVDKLPTEKQAVQFQEMINGLSENTQQKLWIDFQQQTSQSAINWLAGLQNQINSKKGQ